LGAELFDVDGRMNDSHHEPNTSLSRNLEVSDVVHFVVHAIYLNSRTYFSVT